MKKFVKDKIRTLDSEYRLEEISGFKGLIIESWGPSNRNPEYNTSLTLIISRLIELRVPYIRVFIISRNLTKAFPRIEDREVVIDEKYSRKIALNKNSDANAIRLQIGKKQKELKTKPNIKGGNNTKRILIFNENITLSFWDKIASNNYSSEEYIDTIGKPTANNGELEKRVEELIKSDLCKPEGSLNPKKDRQSIEVFERDPKIKAWILSNANGICECCNEEAPFIKENGLPYLEVHHLFLLSDNGSDKISNTVALCPNCHKKMHFAKDKLIERDRIIAAIGRLENRN